MGHKYKIGQRIEKVRNVSAKIKGIITDCIIVDIIPTYVVSINRNGNTLYAHWYEKNVELCDIANTAIARKMYPNAKVVGDRLIVR